MSHWLIGFSPEYLAGLVGTWVVLVLLALTFLRLRPWRFQRPALRLATRLFLLTYSLTFTLVGMETAFAFLYDTTDSFSLSLASRRWFDRHVRLNNWSYRDDRPYTFARRAGVRRVAIVGDSFAFGQGIADRDQLFASRLVPLLEQADHGTTGTRWETYLLAVPGFDTRAELHILRDHFKNGFEADLVLLVYCLNDLEHLVPGHTEQVAQIVDKDPEFWFLRELYLPNFLYWRTKRFQQPEFQDYFGWLTTGYEGTVWEKQKALLRQFIELCREREVALGVVVFPFLNDLGEDYKFEFAHEKLRDFFAAEGVPMLDLLPVFREDPGPWTLHPFDAHPNARAHALAAEVIAEWIPAWLAPAGVGSTPPPKENQP